MAKTHEPKSPPSEGTQPDHATKDEPRRGWRDRPVEEEADKDIKEGGMERQPPRDRSASTEHPP